MCGWRRRHSSTGPTSEWRSRRRVHRDPAADHQRPVLASGRGRPSTDQLAKPALSNGRYHRVAGLGVWYASDQEQASWAELMRHFVDDGFDPFELRCRVGRVKVDRLQVLDLTDPEVCAAVGLVEADLTGDDYTKTQAVAAAAAAAGFAGLLAPSAAFPGRRTLVVFANGAAAITAEWSAVGQPPPRLAHLLHAIRVRADVPLAVRDVLARLAVAGSDAVRRRRC